MRLILIAFALSISISIGQTPLSIEMQKELKNAPLYDAPGPGYPKHSILIKETINWEKFNAQNSPLRQNLWTATPMSLNNNSKGKSPDGAIFCPVELRLSK